MSATEHRFDLVVTGLLTIVRQLTTTRQLTVAENLSLLRATSHHDFTKLIAKSRAVKPLIPPEFNSIGWNMRCSHYRRGVQ